MTMFRPAALVASLLACASAAAAQPATQAILVWSYGFSPMPLHLTAGRPVTLFFENRSGASHDFSARRFFASSTILSGSTPGGEVDLPPRTTVTITLIPRAGSYDAHCSHFFHKQLGMSEQILVD